MATRGGESDGAVVVPGQGGSDRGGPLAARTPLDTWCRGGLACVRCAPVRVNDGAVLCDGVDQRGCDVMATQSISDVIGDTVRGDTIGGATSMSFSIGGATSTTSCSTGEAGCGGKMMGCVLRVAEMTSIPVIWPVVVPGRAQGGRSDGPEIRLSRAHCRGGGASDRGGRRHRGVGTRSMHPCRRGSGVER